MEIVIRDCCGLYAQGTREGTPQARLGREPLPPHAERAENDRDAIEPQRPIDGQGAFAKLAPETLRYVFPAGFATAILIAVAPFTNIPGDMNGHISRVLNMCKIRL